MRWTLLVVLAGCPLNNTLSPGDGGPIVDDFTVGLAVDNATVTEGAFIDVMITVSPAGPAFTVPYSIVGMGADASDYTIVNGSPVSVPAGVTSHSFRIATTDDMLVEGAESLVFTLGQPSRGTLGTSTVTVTIADNDASCYGTGTFSVCFSTPPTGPVALPLTIDTDASPFCALTQPLGWTAQGQPPACVIAGNSITSSGSVSAFGSRPLVLVATTTINIAGLVDVSSHRISMTGATPVIGPGAPSTLCAAFIPAALNGDDSSGGGGGAGGSYFTKGGNGGNGKGGNTPGAAPNPETVLPTILRAGCSGQKGRDGDDPAGAPGRGGGAIYLVAGGMITVTGAGTINASGAGGSIGMDSAGGSGGGSGGTIKLHAPATAVTGARLVANGGAGSGSADDGGGAAPGGEANPLMPTMPAVGGGNVADGGDGFAGGDMATNGENASGGSANAGGGGGGGGGGLIDSNLPLTGAATSAGRVVQ